MFIMKISPISISTVETGVDLSLHSNDLDYEVERKFGWGWQDWKTLLGKPNAFWTFDFTIFGNLAHRWMWAKPHPGT